jgi:hypothetical protein
MLPAVRLVSAISGEKAPGNYTRAKALFLDGLQSAGVHAEALSQQLLKTVAGGKAAVGKGGGPGAAGGAGGAEAGVGGAAAERARVQQEGGMMPALQQLTGHWRGVLQVGLKSKGPEVYLCVRYAEKETSRL